MRPSVTNHDPRSQSRSFLYVPALEPHKLGRALDCGADAIIVDLEDSVAAARKEEARSAARAWLGVSAANVANHVQIWVRINQGTVGEEDLQALSGLSLAGICVPKVHGVENLEPVQAWLGDRYTQPPGQGRPELMAMIESANGILRCEHIARCEGVTRLQLGEYDLGAELGTVPDAAGTAFLTARMLVVLASAAAGIAPPVAPVCSEFKDLEQFGSSTEALCRLGFRARACIHPAQVPIANAVFSPAPAALERARQVLQGARAAQQEGTGAWRAPDGTMVDAAVVRAARRQLAEGSSDQVQGGPA